MQVKTKTNASRRDQRKECFMAGGIAAAVDFHKAGHQLVLGSPLAQMGHLRFLLGAARLRTDGPSGFMPSNLAKAVLEGNVPRL
jgi:hypothetical protein